MTNRYNRNAEILVQKRPAQKWFTKTDLDTRCTPVVPWQGCCRGQMPPSWIV